jgi:hypothetical protein
MRSRHLLPAWARERWLASGRCDTVDLDQKETRRSGFLITGYRYYKCAVALRLSENPKAAAKKPKHPGIRQAG